MACATGSVILVGTRYRYNSHHNWCVVPSLTRGLLLNGLDQLWVADITYLHLAEEFGYLAVILDAFSRKVAAGRWKRICRRN